MNDASQLATALVAFTFAAVLLISGQWFVGSRLQHEAKTPRTSAAIMVATLPP